MLCRSDFVAGEIAECQGLFRRSKDGRGQPTSMSGPHFGEPKKYGVGRISETIWRDDYIVLHDLEFDFYTGLDSLSLKTASTEHSITAIRGSSAIAGCGHHLV